MRGDFTALEAHTLQRAGSRALAAARRARALRIHRRSSPGPHARSIGSRRGQRRGTSLSCVPENTAQSTSGLALFWAAHTRHTRASPQKPWKLPRAPQGELSDGNTDSSPQRRSPRSKGRGGGAAGGDAPGPLPHTCPAQIWDLPSLRSAGGRGLACSLCNTCGHRAAQDGTGGCLDPGSPWLDACRGRNGNAGRGCEGPGACGGWALGRPRQRVGEGGPQRPRQTFGTEMRHLRLVHRSGTAHLPPRTLCTHVCTRTRTTPTVTGLDPVLLLPAPHAKAGNPQSPFPNRPVPGAVGPAGAPGGLWTGPVCSLCGEQVGTGRGRPRCGFHGPAPPLALGSRRPRLFPSLGPQREERKARHWVTRLGRK